MIVAEWALVFVLLCLAYEVVLICFCNTETALDAAKAQDAKSMIKVDCGEVPSVTAIPVQIDRGSFTREGTGVYTFPDRHEHVVRLDTYVLLDELMADISRMADRIKKDGDGTPREWYILNRTWHDLNDAKRIREGRS